jgi:hypothetical protein
MMELSKAQDIASKYRIIKEMENLFSYAPDSRY